MVTNVKNLKMSEFDGDWRLSTLSITNKEDKK